MSDTPQIELTEQALGAAADKAIAAFDAAETLDELAAARREHLGDGGYIPVSYTHLTLPTIYSV